MAVTLGFIGLGSMGLPMTQHLLKAGHAVVVYDLNADAVKEAEANGAEAGTSPADVASRAEIIFASVNTPQALVDIVLGEDGARHGGQLRIFVDLSTTGPTTEEKIAAGLEGTGVTLVDSPISGGRRGAIAGTLAVMMAGPDAACEEVEPLIKTFGKNLFRIGDTPGQAQTMKVANTLMASTASAVTAEVLVMGVKAGLDPSLMIDVFNTSTARNSATAEKFPDAVLPRTFNLGVDARHRAEGPQPVSGCGQGGWRTAHARNCCRRLVGAKYGGQRRDSRQLDHREILGIESRCDRR